MRKWFITLMAVSFVGMWASLLGYKAVDRIQNTPVTSLPDVIQDVIPSVVHVQAERWQGSGVAITEDIIVTARHVVGGDDYTVTLNDGRQVKGIRAVSHKDYDVGFIKVDKPVLEPAEFGKITDCVLGQQVFIVGSPYGKICFNNVTLGIISNLKPNWDFTDRWTGEDYGWSVTFLSDAAAHPGNSGGPVFTLDGKVRGLLVGSISPVLNCSVPSDLFIGDIENIKLMFALDRYEYEPAAVNIYEIVGQ